MALDHMCKSTTRLKGRKPDACFPSTPLLGQLGVRDMGPRKMKSVSEFWGAQAFTHSFTK